MSLEQLAVFVIFALVAFFNLLVRWLKRRMEPPAPDQPQREPEVRAVPVSPRPARVAPVELAPAIVRAPPRPAPTATRRRASTPLAGPADLRSGIVAMAVLGPCRGLQPDGPDAVR